MVHIALLSHNLLFNSHFLRIGVHFSDCEGLPEEVFIDLSERDLSKARALLELPFIKNRPLWKFVLSDFTTSLIH